MLQCAVRRRVIAVLLVAIAFMPGTTFGASSGESILEHLLDAGPAFSVGFGVSPLRWSLAPVVSTPGAQIGESGRIVDLDSQGTVTSFDIKLRWPGAELIPALEPYLAFGPAVFVVEPDYVGRLLGTRVDPAYRLGAKAAAGVNWRLGKDTALFGEYELTTARPGALPATGGPGDGGISGFDFTYGLRLRY
jgi:hypothetical protein